MSSAQLTSEIKAGLGRTGERAITFRAILLALGIAAICAFVGTYHDGAVANREMTGTQYTAPLFMAGLFGILLITNGLLGWIRRSWALRGTELGLILAVLLIVAPLSRGVVHGLVGTVGYTQALIDAKHPAMAGVQRVNPYDALPPGALLSADASNQFDRGLPAGESVPWGKWAEPMDYWVPLLGIFLILSVSFGYMLYRQWAVRELVPFPLAELAASLVKRQDGKLLPDVLYRPTFWIGFGLVVVVFGINGLHGHMDKMIEIPTSFTYYELTAKFPFLRDSHEGYSLLRGWLFVTVVAVAVLLPSEISFTSWVTWPVMVVGSYVFLTQSGRRYTSTDNVVVEMGAFWAMAALLLYAGRVFYLNLLRRALGIGGGESIDRQSVWAARVFLLAVTAFVVVLRIRGIPLDLAILWVLCLIVMMLVICRLVAEMGVPWTPLSGVGPLPMLIAAVGKGAIGVKAYALLTVFGNLLLPSKNLVLLAPAVLNGAHVEAQTNDGRNPSVRIIVPFMLAVLGLCVAGSIWLGYHSSGEANDYVTEGGGMSDVTAAANTLASWVDVRGGRGHGGSNLGQWVRSEPQTMLERWKSIEIRSEVVGFFAFGFALVLLTGVLRLKFPRFPLHPLPLVLIGSWLMSRFWGSFLIGWLLKTTMLQIGGVRLFERSRPLLVGAVTGQAVIFAVWIVANIFIYRANNGTFDVRWLEILQSII